MAELGSQGVFQIIGYEGMEFIAERTVSLKINCVQATTKFYGVKGTGKGVEGGEIKLGNRQGFFF